MKLNNLEKFLKKVNGGEMAYGTCVTFADCAVTEAACEVGFDFVWIDGEHGVCYMSVKNDTNAMIDGWRVALAKART